MESGVGVNSPEFLQKKIERLKTALDEANALMDRQVTERDEARAELAQLRRENADLRRQVEAGGGAAAAPAAAAEPAVDPAIEQELHDRIEELEAQVADAQSGKPAEEQELHDRITSLQAELSTAKRELADARKQAADATTAAAAATTAAANAERRASSPGHAPAGQSDGDLPVPGPFVSADTIRDALTNGGFVLFCQPVFSLKTESITQYELLLRLRDADGRMVRPFGFLEPADRYGLMADIDRWVVGQALDLLTDDQSGDLRLEVNLAGQSIGDPELISLIEQQIAVTDLDPARLILEVSENVAVAHLEDTIKLTKQLRGLGCGFALDDFGSTFASFRHLRDLPVNYLKIDGDLVVTVTESRTGQLTIKSLVELAKGLGAETIAEFVSDDQTLEFLREQGVGYAQGYRIGRPRPIDEVLKTKTPEKKAKGGRGSDADAAESAADREAAAS